jgi:hypothetical protein
MFGNSSMRSPKVGTRTKSRRVKENPDLEVSVSNLGCFFVAIEVHFFLRMTIILLSERPGGTAVVTGLG